MCVLRCVVAVWAGVQSVAARACSVRRVTRWLVAADGFCMLQFPENFQQFQPWMIVSNQKEANAANLIGLLAET